MKLLHVADVHLGASVAGYTNAPADALDSLVGHGIEQEVDLVLLAGDTFDSRRPGPDELRRAAVAVRRLVDAGIPVVFGTGNHDGYGTVADPTSHTFAWWRELGLDKVTVLIEAGETLVETRAGTLSVTHVPYPHKRMSETQGLTLQEAVVASGQRTTRLIAELAEKRTAGLRSVLLAHVTVEGSKVGSDAVMRLGWDSMVDPVVLEPWDYAALGHVHRQQELAANAWYAGSPVPLNWSDEATSHGALLVELGRTVRVEPVSLGGPVFASVELPDGDAFESWLVSAPSGRTLWRVKLGVPANAVLRRKVVDELRSRGAASVDVVFAPPSRPGVRAVVDTLDVDGLIDEYADRHADGQADRVKMVARDIVQSVRNGGEI